MLHQIHIKTFLHFAKHNLSLPTFATAQSAGIDLHACIEEDLILEANACVLVPSGIAVHIGNSHYAGFIYPRSGLGHKHGIVLGNGVGVIDADYQGEIFVSLLNRSKQRYVVKPGERIAQLVFQPIARPSFITVNDFEHVSARGNAGFGSTGRFQETHTTLNTHTNE